MVILTNSLKTSIRTSGTLKKSSAVNLNRLGIRLLNKYTMASKDEQSGFVLHSIKAIDQGESKYVKPVRMNFTLNGRTRNWDCLKAHDSVASVIFDLSRHRLIYVKQFRPAVYLSTLTKNTSNLTDFNPDKLDTPASEKVGYTMELCAGIVDKEGKTPQEIMREEILEETGYDVPLESVKFISSFRGSTGLSGTLMHLYFTEVTEEQRVGRGGGVDDEDIEIIKICPRDVMKLVYCKDEDAPFARPPAMLFGTSWFYYEYYTKYHLIT